MLLINADDYGLNRVATENSMACFRKGRIASVSAMVFMRESPRAAELALEFGLDAGLHLNFTLKFDGRIKSRKLIECQQRIASFLKANKYSFLLYNPLLKNDFNYIFAAQYEEYVRLYKKDPTHIDGHHHLHLCTNMLVDGLIPKGIKVRRNFTFSWGEKNVLNRLYRRIVDAILVKSYSCTDFFFSLSVLLKKKRLRSAVDLARSQTVEVMTHPEINQEFDYLMSDEYYDIISHVIIGNYYLLEATHRGEKS